jgi:RNA polymerase sigma-70 factor (ECF subfamily)
MAGSASGADLVNRCLAGDERAWEMLVDRFERYVFAIVTRSYRLRDTAAEDAFQDVFARVFERLHTLRDPDALQPWIAQTTRRVCLDRLRADGRETLLAEPEDVVGDDPFDRLDQALVVRDALNALPGECAEVVDRFFCRDESYRTIGEALDLPAGTIASRISRCLEKLRAAIVEPELATIGKKADASGVQ